MLNNITITLILFIFTATTYANIFPSNTRYQVCFTPGGRCTHAIVELIDNAKKSVYVQAYSFTSKRIANALVRAHRRGIEVKVIFDKSNFDGHHYSQARYLVRQGVTAWDDYQLGIAHNKVIIVDGDVVETGSFNFTNAAQHYNAENVLIIYDKKLAQQYLRNWQHRKDRSHEVNLHYRKHGWW
jgi:phosphatidylserine/phosphatidylglycerophosphate/cardiolipin synthase-like enzyme